MSLFSGDFIRVLGGFSSLQLRALGVKCFGPFSGHFRVGLEACKFQASVAARRRLRARALGSRAKVHGTGFLGGLNGFRVSA